MIGSNEPLAERMRPRSLDEFIGQKHLVGPDKVIRKMLLTGRISSMILWGPPGSGKTTLANIISEELKVSFFSLSAISAGVKDIRQVIQTAKMSGNAILFIDEIHRFSKSQQESLLAAVEKGLLTLIGATTENPSFEVISPLLSRCQVYVLNSLSKEDLIELINNALKKDPLLQTKKVDLKEMDSLLQLSGGDARKLLNLFEIIYGTEEGDEVVVTNEKVMDIAQKNIAIYDKGGDQHYDIISALIKSIRGSDPNGALYWLARMINGGEDPKFIARRLLILASEDIGNANPTALVLANSCFQAVQVIGYPECELILSQTTIYLATSPKSNASYQAIGKAKKKADQSKDLHVPLHLRNAPTGLMKELDYGKDYKYPHSFDKNFTEQEYLPDSIKGSTFYDPGENPRENEIRAFLKKLWGNKYDY